MELVIHYEELAKAIAIVEDYLFKCELETSNEEELKLLKLLQARENNPRFESDIAEMVCGDGNNAFPYRTSYYLTEFFRNLGFRFEHDGSTRRFWVEHVLKQMNIKELAIVIRKGLFNKRDFRNYAKREEKDFEEIYSSAIQEFKDLIEDSTDNSELDLAFLLNMNVNTDILFNQNSNTKDSALNSLIKEAKQRFLNPKDKHIALEKIWDAFERIKTYYNKDKKKSVQELIGKVSSEIEAQEFEEEFKKLTNIGNNYKIRHHEQGKKELTDENQIQYLFFRVMTLIDLCVSVINKES